MGSIKGCGWGRSSWEPYGSRGPGICLVHRPKTALNYHATSWADEVGMSAGGRVRELYAVPWFVLLGGALAYGGAANKNMYYLLLCHDVVTL